MQKTQIEWAQNPDGTQGYTSNPITGCLNHDKGLCKGGGFPCYAFRLAHGQLKNVYRANSGIAGWGNMSDFERKEAAADPFWPRVWRDRVAKLYDLELDRKPKGIFLCDMGDLFGDGVREDWTNEILDIVKKCSQHRFYLLTKKPKNLPRFSPFPDNAWVGITATNQETYYDGVSNIAKVEAKVKFVSFEPLLERINGGECAEEYRLDSIDEFDWVIIGACTGTYTELVALIQRYPSLELRRCGPNRYVAVPPPGWVREIMSAADAANVPVFIKNNILDTAEGEYRLTERRREMPHATI